MTTRTSLRAAAKRREVSEWQSYTNDRGRGGEEEEEEGEEEEGEEEGEEEEEENVDDAPAHANVVRTSTSGGGRLRWCSGCQAFIHRDGNGEINIRLHGLTLTAGHRRRDGFEREEEQKDRKRRKRR